MKRFNKNLQLIIIAIFSLILIGGCHSGDTGNNIKPTSVSASQAEMMDHGFVTYYFVNESSTPKYSIPVLDNTIIKADLAKNRNLSAISMLAKTKLVVNVTGNYKLMTSHPEANILLDGAKVSKTGVNLESGRVYDLTIYYKPIDNAVKDIKLQWIKPGATNIADIPLKNLLFGVSNGFGNKSAQVADANSGCVAYMLPDTSCNGIPDEWAMTGYTVYTNPTTGRIILEQWDPAIHAKNPIYTKYVSAVYKYSTADDPYSDYQKVTGIGLDKTVMKSARNPLVAAYPIIKLGVESVIISKLITITAESGGESSNTITADSTNTTADQLTEEKGGSVTIGVSFVGLTGSATGNYSRTNSQTSTVSTESSTSGTGTKNWSQAINLNSGEAAYFYPVIRYGNLGTATAINLQPTFTFSIAKSGKVHHTTKLGHLLSRHCCHKIC